MIRLAVTGPLGAGKTAALAQAARTLAAAGVPCGGVLQPAVRRADHRRGYDLVPFGPGGLPPERLAGSLADPASPDRRPLVRFGPAGPAFDPPGLAAGAAAIAAARAAGAVVIVDELGWLEAQGGGHLPALLAPPAAGGREPPAWLLAVRADVAAAVAARLGGFEELWTLPDGAAAFARRVGELLVRGDWEREGR